MKTQRNIRSSNSRKRWLVITGIGVVFYGVAIYLFEFYVSFSPEIFPWLIPIIILSCYICEFIATAVAPYPHNKLKHPLCYLGQSDVFGKLNYQSMIIIQGFFIGWGSLYAILGKLIRSTVSDNPILQAIGVFLYICAFLTVMLGLVPINQSRKGHLGITFTLFAINYSLMILLTCYFLYLKQFGVLIPFYYYVGGFLYLIFAAVYLLSYILQKHASFFQNFWLLGTLIGLWAYIEAFRFLVTD